MDQKGLTIIELMTVLFLTSILVIGLTQVYIIGLKLWHEGYERQTAGNQMGQSLERLTRSLRQARSIDQFDEGSITFSADLGQGIRSYRIYLYHAADAEPNPPYSQDSYELRFADDNTAYGEGVILATGIEQPAGPSFIRNDDLISIDLTRIYLDSSQRWRSNVQLRNL